MKRLLKVAAAIAFLPAVASAQNLTWLGAVPFTGGGLGSVPTVLTLNNSNNISTGCITPTATSCTGFPDNTVHESSQVRLISELGGSGDFGTDLRIIANFSEPDTDGIIQDLVLYVYNGNTVVRSYAYTGADITLTNTDPGIGNAGFGFGLDAVAAADLTALVLAGGATSIGLAASLSDVQGGLETFRVVRANATTSVVPEPSTYALMAAGLAGIFMARRRRNRA